MIKLIAGAAVGYVLGSKAGRERYEKIRKLSADVAQKPAVQQAISSARAKVPSKLGGKKPQQAAPQADTVDVVLVPEPTVAGAYEV